MLPALPSLEFAAPAELPTEAIIGNPVARAASPSRDDSPEDSELLDPEWAAEEPHEFLRIRNRAVRLVLTPSRKILFLSQFPDSLLCPQSYTAAAFLLYLCANPRTRWNAPTPDEEGGLLAPLHRRPDAFIDDVDGWADRCLKSMPPEEMRLLAVRLWTREHANQVIVPDDSKKNVRRTLKAPPSIPSADSAISSPVETLPDIDGSCMNAPSGSSTTSSPVIS